MKKYFQVPKSVYKDFIKFLRNKQMFYVQNTEATLWCIIKVDSSSNKLDEANSYLGQLIARI